MPGPVSTSYDPEWGSGEVADEIDLALETVYKELTVILAGQEPNYILNVVRGETGEYIQATLTEREWRLLRFSIERARMFL
jgi:hypothetical protein